MSQKTIIEAARLAELASSSRVDRDAQELAEGFRIEARLLQWESEKKVEHDANQAKCLIDMVERKFQEHAENTAKKAGAAACDAIKDWLGKPTKKHAKKRAREDDEDDDSCEEDEDKPLVTGKYAHISDRFSPRLRDAAKLLAKRWGYRANNDGGFLRHSDFELRTHEVGLFPLQAYTDLVFRNAWNIGELDALFGSDIYPKVRTIYGNVGFSGPGIISVMDEATRSRWCDLLEEFFKPGSEVDVLATRFAAELEAEISMATSDGEDSKMLTTILSGLRLLQNFADIPPISKDVLDKYFRE